MLAASRLLPWLTLMPETLRACAGNQFNFKEIAIQGLLYSRERRAWSAARSYMLPSSRSITDRILKFRSDGSCRWYLTKTRIRGLSWDVREEAGFSVQREVVLHRRLSIKLLSQLRTATVTSQRMIVSYTASLFEVAAKSTAAHPRTRQTPSRSRASKLFQPDGSSMLRRLTR